MLNVAFRELAEHHTLTPARLQRELDVKRSAAVCALLARVPGVDVVHHPSTHLRYHVDH
jgi:hypothetical protein